MFHHSKWFHHIMSIILIGWLYHTKVYKARLLKHIASDTGRKHMPHYTEKMLVLCISDVHINYPPMMIIAVTAFPPCFCFCSVLSLFLPCFVETAFTGETSWEPLTIWPQFSSFLKHHSIQAISLCNSASFTCDYNHPQCWRSPELTVRTFSRLNAFTGLGPIGAYGSSFQPHRDLSHPIAPHTVYPTFLSSVSALISCLVEWPPFPL